MTVEDIQKRVRFTKLNMLGFDTRTGQVGEFFTITNWPIFGPADKKDIEQ